MNPHPSEPTLPEALAWAFKEWSGVCDALLAGRQAVILRKGGIAEGPGPGEFRPEHSAFWLYPTAIHEGQQGLRDDFEPGPGPPTVGPIPVSGLAVVETCLWVDDPARLRAIEGLHVWTRETVERRFAYRHPGLWVLGVRAYRWQEPWPLERDARYEGCKSWVPLTMAIPTGGLAPALGDREHARRMEDLRDALEPRNPGPPEADDRTHA